MLLSIIIYSLDKKLLSKYNSPISVLLKTNEKYKGYQYKTKVFCIAWQSFSIIYKNYARKALYSI